MNLKEIHESLAKLDNWSLDGNSIVKEYTFKDFKEALVFVNEVGMIAESQGHHPDITINYNKVTLSSTTHSAGTLTVKDFSLAAEIDSLE